MTKTAAAKRFAEAYGTYNADLDEYRVGPLLRKVGEPTGIQEAIERNVRLREERDSLLKTAMTLLGVEAQYEDTVEETVIYSSPYGITQKDTVTKTAVSKFADDLKAAQNAIDGEAALKRLRKAAKAARKEGSQ